MSSSPTGKRKEQYIAVRSTRGKVDLTSRKHPPEEEMIISILRSQISETAIDVDREWIAHRPTVSMRILGTEK